MESNKQMEKNKIPYQGDPGFSVPSNYFEELDGQLLDMARQTGNDFRLVEEMPSSGFKTPENYFDGLEERILDKVQKDKKQPKVIPLFQKEYWYYAAGIAAIVIALAGTLFVNPVAEDSWENVEVSVLESYIDGNNIDFSTTEISTFLFEEGGTVDDASFSEMNSEVMFDYLDENIEDPSFILE